MAEVSGLKRSRRAHRSNAKKLMREAKELLASETKENDELLKQKIALSSKLEKIAKLDDDILLSISQNTDVGEEEISLETEEAETLSTEMQMLIFKLDEAIAVRAARIKSPRRMLPVNPTSSDFENATSALLQGTPPHMSSLSTDTQRSTQRSTQRKARLPKLEMKRFSGNICQWQEFWDCFESSVDGDQELAPVVKLNYLRGLLDGPAKAAVAGFESTNANYNEALEVLKERYGKRSVIQRSHINGIKSVNAVRDDEDILGLRRFQDTIEVHYRRLKALGVQEEVYSTIAVPLIIEKLQKDLRLNITRGSQFLEWNVKDVLTALQKELELREEIARTSTKKEVPRRTGMGVQRATASAFLREKADECPFYLGKHEAKHCMKVRTAKERKNSLRKYSRCLKIRLNCLKIRP